jgi:hypothetical protein
MSIWVVSFTSGWSGTSGYEHYCISIHCLFLKVQFYKGVTFDFRRFMFKFHKNLQKGSLLSVK